MPGDADRNSDWVEDRPQRAGSDHHADKLPADLIEALNRLRCGEFVMTAQFEDERSGARVLSVQPCALEPMLVSVSLRKGHVVEPLIRDSRMFGLCELSSKDRLAKRKFPADDAGDEADPFTSLSLRRSRFGVPLLSKSPLGLECEVVRHFDLEADHVLYIGLVTGGWCSPPEQVASSGTDEGASE